MMGEIDFTNCSQIPGRAYNGANGKKIAVEHNGKEYMLKFPPSGDKKKTDLSYTNSCISEHIASGIFNILGVTAHDTMLGTFVIGDTTKIVCACLDFTIGGKILYDFCSIKNTVIDSESGGTGTELNDILDTIEKQKFIAPDLLVAFFWDMFVVDALLGNFDRHNGNWGFLHDPVSGISEIAPVFDCGSCLLPQADEIVMQEVMNNESALNARVFQYPTSAIKHDDKKINYFDFMMKAKNEDYCKALQRIYNRIDMNTIRDFVNQIPYISDLQKSFYIQYITARFDIILRPSYKIINSDE
ncbi:MAG: HipA domain-containing protein [Oscillospiraceae bacterium]|nr:HipA domain-containing protein [Oscillospiraceae bacterium]